MRRKHVLSINRSGKKMVVSLFLFGVSVRPAATRSDQIYIYICCSFSHTDLGIEVGLGSCMHGEHGIVLLPNMSSSLLALLLRY